MCTGLDPDFNVWKGLAPFAQELIQEEAGEIWEQLLEQATSWGKLLFNLPKRLDSTLTKLERGKIAIRTPELERRLSRLEQSNRKQVGAVIFAALLLGGIQLILGEVMVPGSILLAGAAITLGWILFTGKGS
jgi:predicted unusual protein kinase regulating ubiquinone biosynthesis (AarF/ABC1/UbiB family)